MTGARDRVLDAYETLLIEKGVGAVTLDAVAAAANVSKGGLLYHFASKDALTEGVLQRLRERSKADADAIRSAPEGSVQYYVRTSAPGFASRSLARSYLAALRLADDSPTGRAARAALAEVDADGYAALCDDLGDPVLALLAQLIGDGLYLRTLAGTPLPPGITVEQLLQRMREIADQD
ncbi:transcriptional regulator, TetR family [Pseudonocardia thermophila]|uniref:Transcriptional regulator, TetR family n=1 Tax=Pseudonocardia thermophila TaxID=1848 RepID=A0A1M6VJL6_PSETH|nr:TetR/AcrR family transcriptional regulator [Pseudonocardia thermophila]SHK81702.1 transcriptional regulator, TetR family [Pseudonocardia thermophila]